MTTSPASPAIFLDRDGTIIDDVGYIRTPEQVNLVEGAASMLAALRRHGYRLILISNQSGVARGLIKIADVHRVHDRMVELLQRSGTTLDGSYYCFHGPSDGCHCRKPAQELIQRAVREHNLDLARSVFIGDKGSDVETGQAAGCETVLLRVPGKSSVARVTSHPDSCAASWAAVYTYLCVRNVISTESAALSGAGRNSTGPLPV